MARQKERRNKSKSMGKQRQREAEIEEQTETPMKLDKKTLLKMKSDEQMIQMKEFYKLITVEPETHVVCASIQFKHVDTIFIFTKADNVKVATTAIRLLAEIFINAAPLEPVDMKQIENRTEVKITKEEFRVLKFEELLVNQYERYLKMLKELNTKLTSASFGSDDEMFKEFKKCILQCVIKCYRTLWNFNHFKLLNEVMVKFIKHDECRETLKSMLSDKNIATLKIKAKIINAIAGLLKDKPESYLPDDLIKIVNATHINTNYLDKDSQALNFKKKKMTKRLYKEKEMEKRKEMEKKRDAKAQKNERGGTLEMKKKIKEEKNQQKMKVREEVNKQFAQGEATISNKELVRSNSAILQEIFYIYFKILIEKINSKYVRDCLDGMLTFAHLINIDLISNLITHLDKSSQYFRDIWLQNKNQHVLENRLLLVFASESLLNGPLSVYNMDDLKVTTNFFKILRDINHHKTSINQEHFRLISMTLEEVLIKRRQLSQEIVGSFLRQMSIFILKDEIPKLYLLELIRQVASKYSRVTKMFEDDNEGYGLNSYNQHCEDPQCTNAINTQIITNLNALAKITAKKKLPKEIPTIVERFCRQNFNRIQGAPLIEQLLGRDLTFIEYKAY